MRGLTPQELNRYARQISLDEVGRAGQERLKRSKVLVIGAGGLGCPALTYLASCGVGTLGIVDGDRVEESNLHRQILFRHDEIGKPKAETAAARIIEINPNIRVQPYNERLTAANAVNIIGDFDLILDGSDNFGTRYLVNDACVISGKPWVSASLFRFSGQISVFNLPDADGGRGPTYRCLYPEPPAAESVPNCSELGVLGIVPGILGALQANEALKVLLGMGTSLSGRVLIINLLTMQSKFLNFERLCDTDGIGALLPNRIYDEMNSKTCSVPSEVVTPQELLALSNDGEILFELLDVRESFEREAASLGGIHIPLAQLDQHLEKLPRDRLLIVYCHSGIRSAKACRQIKAVFQGLDVRNLQGGIIACPPELLSQDK
ncbi:MAG: molybdopterin-synthase adenylyltransferase MoeB [Deltaproteobacteria bacterium]|nr:molybdopterin-synthase adenylyltransferase MoeB [Deltaproteobacteria bacterium]